MPAQTIIKLKIRRGTDSQRKAVILEQGELGYTTDKARVFVGDGTTYGGRPVGSVFHTPVNSFIGRTTVTGAVQNDIVVERSLMYQLTGTDYSVAGNWRNISPRVDGTVIRYVTEGTNYNVLTLGDASVGYTKFSGSVVALNGGLSLGVGLSANVDNVTMHITGNKLAVKGVTKDSISSTSFGNSISGGSGNLINVNFDPSYFGYNVSSQLTITRVPPGTVTVSSLSSNFIGAGLQAVEGRLQANLQDVDNVSLESTGGVISLKAKHAGNVSTRFDNINYNEDGVITGRSSMFGFLLSGSNASTGSAYNGTIDQDSYTNQQVFEALYTDITTAGTSYMASVSSAGFIVINSSSSGDLAIPVFRFSPVVNLTGGPIS
jgi:hypothetical protein